MFISGYANKGTIFYCLNCEFLDVRTTGIHSIITSCSCVISMDLTVCHKQIAEEWRQQIIVVAKHKFSSIERINLENI